ncbi:pilus assembly protein PilP [Ferrimonas lipolytica]|uniref:Pilus assembly protein PilP n=1 Tax=Ferrimonas lipolytica TaxID=2724191 RepID=A0A6H1UHC6_9GAMM|nr:pilus assembly protein PilP [Ferrimonas lipolytica]QIZ78507.1 pilus assembly protein PilP [Ferrimonas lipolytica]
MKKLAVVVSSMFLSACTNNLNDLHQYVAEVQADPVVFNETTPEPPEITVVPYSVADLRSPFRYQRVRLDEREGDNRNDCPQPDLERERGPLEAYGVDSFRLRGVMRDDIEQWALLQSSDGTVYSVKQGDYLGMFHGQVESIGQVELVVAEWIPDGRGCWTKRETQLAMANN